MVHDNNLNDLKCIFDGVRIGMGWLLGKMSEKYFADVLWPKWMRIVAASSSPFEWEKCFLRAADQSGIAFSVAREVCRAPALHRLLVNSYRPDRSVPSATDFALSIAFEIYGLDGLKKGMISPSKIRHMAVNVRREWLLTIIESPILKERFKQIRDEHPARYISSDSSCLDLDSVLMDRMSLLVGYFSTYAVSSATEEIVVWLPNEMGVVYPCSNICHGVSVLVNSSEGVDRGFFRVGFDYTLKRTGRCLKFCYLDNRRMVESGNFDGDYVGRKFEALIWAR